MGKLDNYIKFLRALANAERLSIIEILEEGGELSASEIESYFFMEQSTASHHLNTLKRAGVLDTRKDGRSVFYSVNQEFIKTFYDEFSEKLLKRELHTENEVHRKK